MKKKDHWWNSLLVIFTIAAAGGVVMYVAFRYWYRPQAEELVVSRTWLLTALGAAYTTGWFITRTVEGAFDFVFTRNPFSRTGADAPKDQEKYPPWLNKLLWTMGYPIFFGMVTLVVGALLVLGTFTYWLVSVVKG